jgi:hypothetical protein
LIQRVAIQCKDLIDHCSRTYLARSAAYLIGFHAALDLRGTAEDKQNLLALFLRGYQVVLELAPFIPGISGLIRS